MHEFLWVIGSNQSASFFLDVEELFKALLRIFKSASALKPNSSFYSPIS